MATLCLTLYLVTAVINHPDIAYLVNFPAVYNCKFHLKLKTLIFGTLIASSVYIFCYEESLTER